MYCYSHYKHKTTSVEMSQTPNVELISPCNECVIKFCVQLHLSVIEY